MATEYYEELSRLDHNLSESDVATISSVHNRTNLVAGRARLYSSMYGPDAIDPNLSRSDLAQPSIEGEFVRRRELQLAARHPERVVVEDVPQPRGHLSLYRRVKAEACLALAHIPTILNCIY